MKFLPTILIGSALFAGWAAYASFFSATYPQSGKQPIVHFPYNSGFIDPQIRVSERAVKLDPGAAMGWAILSSDYMARSRESDDLATALKAEAAARKSLAIRRIGNVSARNKITQSLLQEHRFKDALANCQEAKRVGIYDDQTDRSLCESLIEIGRYSDAEKVIYGNTRAFQGASGEAIQSRLLDVKGRSKESLSLLLVATKQADDAPAMPSDAIAWFHTRVGIQLGKMGRHDESRKQFQTALSLYPRDYKAMAGLARLAFQDGQWADAVAWGNRSDTIAQMADVRALVGDAEAMLGDPTQAEAQYGRVATLVGRPSGLNDGLHEVTPGAGTHGHRLDRQYAVFCADHGRDPDGAYAAAIRDFDSRHDIYAYDTLAWVCDHAGKVDEAVKGIEMALATHAEDPTLFYHAGSIYASAGKKDKAAEYFRKALAIDPHFDGIQAPKAAKFLASQAIPNTKLALR